MSLIHFRENFTHASPFGLAGEEKKMKKVLLVMAVLAIFALPAMAQYGGSIDPGHEYWTYQWYSGFESNAAGQIAGTNKTGQPFNYGGSSNWVNPNLTGTFTNLGGNVVNDPANALAGSKFFQSGPGGSGSIGMASTRAFNDIPELGVNNARWQSYKEGFVEYWVYDPNGVTTGTVNKVDTRAWVTTNAYRPTSTTTTSSYTWGATLGDSRTNGKTYWVFAMGGTFVAADGSGATAGGGAGGGLVFQSISGQARTRSVGWHQVQLYWNFTNTAGRLEMYVDDMITPAVVADFGSQNSRWGNMKYVSGIFLGNTQGVITNAGRIDDVSFYGRGLAMTPEPSSLLALGAGAMGLLGLIRRKR